MTYVWVRAIAVPLLLWSARGPAVYGAAAGDPPARPEPQAADSDLLLFDRMPVVQAASLHTQALEDAPASVTVISREEIRRYGYRTLAEALSNVRGFYPTQDSLLTYAGVRGFSLLGDYNARFLVMVNGHHLTDNVYNSMYMFERDFPVDLELVERIEIIRGPSSALYGSNGIFATINVVTRSPVDHERASLALDVGSFGEKRLFAASSFYLGRGANLLVSASGVHAAGRTMFAPEPGLTTEGVGAHDAYRSFVNLVWGEWSVTAAFGDRAIFGPAGTYGTVFGGMGSRSRDTHNFVEAAWSRELGQAARLRWRLYYDQYRYIARWDMPLDEESFEDTRDRALGDWTGSELTYSRATGKSGQFSAGLEAKADFRNVQENYARAPEFEPRMYVSKGLRSYGVFAQQQWNFSRNWTALAGARFDGANYFRNSVSPRLAVIYKWTPASALKILYGRAFRNPSMFEMFYGGGDISYAAGYTQNPALRPERVDTLEASIERRLHRRADLIASVYHYRLAGLIGGRELEPGVFQYQNMSRARAGGFEIELRGRPLDWLETSAAWTAQRARNSTTDRPLENSPWHNGYFRASVPLLGQRLSIAPVFRFIGSRETPFERTAPGVPLADLTLTTNRLHRNFDVQFGLRNVLNRRYVHPMSAEHSLTEYPGTGRTFFIRLLWRFLE